MHSSRQMQRLEFLETYTSSTLFQTLFYQDVHRSQNNQPQLLASLEWFPVAQQKSDTLAQAAPRPSVSQGLEPGALSQLGRVLEIFLCWSMMSISSSREEDSGLTPQALDACSSPLGSIPEVHWHIHVLDEAKDLSRCAQPETRAWLMLSPSHVLCSVLLTVK